jgi:hypothetical protein
VLANALGNVTITGGDGRWTFKVSEQGERECLTLHYNDKGITKIVLADELSGKAAQDALIDSVQEAINGNHGEKISSRQLFCALPLEGIFNWNDNVFLRPSATQTVIGMGLEHNTFVGNVPKRTLANPEFGPPFPVVLEVRHRASSNHLLETNWMLRRLDLFQYALTVLLAPPILFAVGPNGRRWVHISVNGEFQNHLLYSRYVEAEHGPTHNKNVVTTAAHYLENDYYDRLWYTDEVLLIPPNIENSLSILDNLELSSQTKFKRAAYWYSIGVEHSHCMAIALPAFSAAIETLLPPATEVCESCERPRGDGIARKFNRILDMYGQISPSIDKPAKAIYDARSRLVHGTQLRTTDDDFFGAQDDTAVEFIIPIMAKRVLIGWLHDPSRESRWLQ